MTETLYARISSENHQWLRDLAAASGLSLARVADLIIDEAKQHEWDVSKAALVRKHREQASDT